MTVPFIGEDIIDSVTEALSDNEKYYDEIVAEMQGKQPILFSYLLSESFKLLTKEESDFLFYLAVVAIAQYSDRKTTHLRGVLLAYVVILRTSPMLEIG